MSELPVITWEFSGGVVRSHPKIAMGRPLIQGCGVSAHTLFDAIEIEGGIEQAAHAYGVEVRHVKLAKQYVDFVDWEEANVTRQANPVEAAGPVAGEAETTSQTTISVEG